MKKIMLFISFLFLVYCQTSKGVNHPEKLALNQYLVISDTIQYQNKFIQDNLLYFRFCGGEFKMNPSFLIAASCVSSNFGKKTYAQNSVFNYRHRGKIYPYNRVYESIDDFCKNNYRVYGYDNSYNIRTYSQNFENSYIAIQQINKVINVFKLSQYDKIEFKQ